jgi:transcriptional regulator with XRE-family HTH domain
MSTSAEQNGGIQAGTPELTALGRQLEMLRLERGLSKQNLARHAGTSRQQLWRVMTGKSELTGSLCERLAEVLGIDSRALRNPEAFARAIAEVAARPVAAAAVAALPAIDGVIPLHGWHGSGSSRAPEPIASTPPSLAEYLASAAHVERTLATYPGGDVGRRLKRQFLDALEDAAADAAVKLPSDFFALRGRVVNGEL